MTIMTESNGTTFSYDGDVSARDVEKLAEEAFDAGDRATVKLCNQALLGSRRAFLKVQKAILASRAEVAYQNATFKE